MQPRFCTYTLDDHLGSPECRALVIFHCSFGTGVGQSFESWGIFLCSLPTVSYLFKVLLGGWDDCPVLLQLVS